MARNLGAAGAREEARIPDPPQRLIFRSRPEPVRRREWHAQFGAVAKRPVSGWHSLLATAMRIRTRVLLLLAAPAFFVAWVSPRLVPISISRFSSSYSTRFSLQPFSLPFLISVSE